MEHNFIHSSFDLLTILDRLEHPTDSFLVPGRRRFLLVQRASVGDDVSSQAGIGAVRSRVQGRGQDHPADPSADEDEYDSSDAL